LEVWRYLTSSTKILRDISDHGWRDKLTIEVKERDGKSPKYHMEEKATSGGIDTVFHQFSTI